MSYKGDFRHILAVYRQFLGFYTYFWVFLHHFTRTPRPYMLRYWGLPLHVSTDMIRKRRFVYIRKVGSFRRNSTVIKIIYPIVPYMTIQFKGRGLFSTAVIVIKLTHTQFSHPLCNLTAPPHPFHQYAPI